MKRTIQWLTILTILVGGAFLLTNLQSSFQAVDVIAQEGDATPGCKAGAPVKDFFLFTGEWKQTKGIAEDRGVAIGGAAVERYTFDPGSISVNVGDCVRLTIHAVQGSHHNAVILGTGVDSFGAPLIDDRGNQVGTAIERPSPNAGVNGPDNLNEGEWARGEQVLLEFTATKAGQLKLVCEIHTFIDVEGNLRGYDNDDEALGGPMVGYINVFMAN